jgi:hypothetical protein
MAALTLLWSTLAFGQAIYTWVDQDGETHFTDDPSTAPKGVKLRTTEGREISSMSMGVRAADGGTVAPKKAPAGPSAPDDSEVRWRKLFREARAKIATLEEEIERDRKQVEEINGMPVTGTYTCYARQTTGTRYVIPCGSNAEHTRIKERLGTNRSALERARVELDDLERRASVAGVPREWRR